MFETTDFLFAGGGGILGYAISLVMKIGGIKGKVNSLDKRQTEINEDLKNTKKQIIWRPEFEQFEARVIDKIEDCKTNLCNKIGDLDKKIDDFIKTNKKRIKTNKKRK